MARHPRHPIAPLAALRGWLRLMVAGRVAVVMMAAVLAVCGLVRVAPAACCGPAAVATTPVTAMGCCPDEAPAPPPPPAPCEGRDVCPRPCCDAAPVEQGAANAPRATVELPEPIVLELPRLATPRARLVAALPPDGSTAPRPPTNTPLHLQLHILLI